MAILSKTVCVVGLGYIGLPTAALLAGKGYKVLGVDVNASTVDTINRGQVHLNEPDLEEYVAQAVATGNLRAELQPQVADIYLICVPTPFYDDKEIPTPNIEFVLSATQSIKHLVKEGDLVILESTSPVGTTEKIKNVLATSDCDIEAVSIAYCPERVLPGRILTELVENDRIVGGVNEASTKAVVEFYETFVEGEVLTCASKTAEMCKLAENSFRDVNIAFANELSMICETHDIDVWELINLANHHPRVNVLQPSTGVGGHCIAVDPWFIVAGDPENARITKLARQVNNTKPSWVVKKINKALLRLADSGISQPKVTCLGIAFKPDIDDLRESPAIEVVNELIAMGQNVSVVEPNIHNHEHFQLVSFDDALEADLVVVLVKHKEFSSVESRARLLGVDALDFCGALI